MITSSQIIKISEDYLLRERNLEVFVNPTRSELSTIANTSKALYNQIRFIADAKDQKLYVWDAYLEIHYYVRRLIKLNPTVIQTPSIINGTANVTNGRTSIINWTDDYDELLYNISNNNSKSKESKVFLNKLLNEYRWNWLSNYVSNGTAFINWKKQEMLQGYKD